MSPSHPPARTLQKGYIHFLDASMEKISLNNAHGILYSLAAPVRNLSGEMAQKPRFIGC